MKRLVPPDAILIPEQARCVFDGEIYSVYQWNQQLYDGSHATFEMLRRADTVMVLVCQGERVLCIEDEQPNRGPLLTLPSGRVEETDTNWQAAAQRELKEETGISCINWRLVSVRQPVAKIEWFTALFLATGIENQTEQQLDAGEKIRLQWRDYASLRADVLAGRLPRLEYLLPILLQAETIAQLQQLAAYRGSENG